jgi:hypothetical protein
MAEMYIEGSNRELSEQAFRDRAYGILYKPADEQQAWGILDRYKGMVPPRATHVTQRYLFWAEGYPLGVSTRPRL